MCVNLCTMTRAINISSTTYHHHQQFNIPNKKKVRAFVVEKYYCCFCRPDYLVLMISILHTFDLQIMEAFKVAPFDQNLCLNGLYLTDSSQTLGQLRVLPKSLIYLRADEPNPGASVMEPDDGWAMQHPEEGFKGEIRFLHFFFFF